MLHVNSSECLTSCYEGDIANNTDYTCMTCPNGLVGLFNVC